MTSLDKKLLQTWKAQLSSWAREGDLLEASKRSLRLKKPPRDLKHWIESVSTGDDFKLPRITLLSSEAMQGAIGAYAGSTKTIYLNRQWSKTAQADDAIAVLNEELGHYLDDKYNPTDTPGDEGRVFAQFILNGNNGNENAFDPKQENNGWIHVSGNSIQVEFLKWKGTTGNDIFPNNLQNNADHDKLSGLGGNDTINGGNGNDKIAGGAGHDSLEGGDGDDTLDGGDHKDTIIGGNGNDIISLKKWGHKADGGTGNDSIIGANQSDIIDGGTGNDTLKGSGGKDTIKGNNGSDNIDGGSGNDLIDGEKGNDKIEGKNGNDKITGGNGNDTINGGNDNDTIDGGNNNDNITGGNGNDSILGMGGDDSINGGNNNDEIYGGGGNDILNGGKHNDEITGGQGNDTINGGHGTDIAIFSGDRCEYTIKYSNPSASLNANTITVSGPDGTDKIKAVEKLSFDDDDIDNVNASPTSSDHTKTSKEDTPTTLDHADFGSFKDADCDTLQSIKITRLQDAGTLEFDSTGAGDWADVNLNDEITIAELDAGRLKFTPVKDENGDDYTTIRFKVGDGDVLSEDAYSLTINVDPVNDLPVLSNADGTLAFKEGDGPSVLDASLSLSDVDDSTIESAIISIADNYQSAEDVLGFIDQNNISGSYNSATGVLSLSGSDSHENYKSALESVTYNNISSNPITTPRTISWLVNDGTNSSTPVSTTVTLNTVNNRPVLGNADGTLAFTEGDGPSILDASLSLSDPDDNTIESASISITDNYQSAEDVLGFIKQNNISGSYNSGTGVLSLSGSDSHENYKTALESVTYNNISSNPTASPRTISWQVNDGTNSSTPISTTITLNTINNRPLLGNADSTLTFTEGDGPSVLDASLNFNDVDSSTIESASIQISANHQATQDVLGFIDQNNISGSYNSATGMLSLSGSDSLENYRNALRSITYNNISENPITMARTITWLVNDGKDSSTPFNTSVTLNAINDRPELSNIDQESIFPIGDQPVVLSTSLSLSDIDNTTIESATVSITDNYYAAEDRLGFNDDPDDNISWDYDSEAGTLTLSGSDSVANYRVALQSITYNNTSRNPTTEQRSISWQVDDGQHSSESIKTLVKITAIGRQAASPDRDPDPILSRPQDSNTPTDRPASEQLNPDNAVASKPAQNTQPDQLAEPNEFTAVPQRPQESTEPNSGSAAEIPAPYKTIQPADLLSDRSQELPIRISTLQSENRDAIYHLKADSKKGTRILDLNHKTTGRDQDQEGTSIQYSIVSGNRKNLFSMNKKGILSLNKDWKKFASRQISETITISCSKPESQEPTFVQAEIVFGNSFQPNNCLSIGHIIQPTNNKFQGSSCPDLWTGHNDAEWIHSKAGHDHLRGKAGNDTIQAGKGHDTVHGGPGLDSLSGNSGNDRLNGRRRADVLRGGPDHDVLKGRRGPDLLFGEQGDDTLRGGSDNDTLQGGPGNDVLQGSAGDDILEGGTGADLFRLSTGLDRIIDFDHNQGDRISFGAHINLSIQQQGPDLLLSDPNHNINTIIEQTLLDQWSNQ
ncbi:hypothetical protein [Synechococcus sp. MIT S1220]|uniref:calcium-binding protein n=1 Tax=Synechococcus sp. MIT S1220 TaxID=3082549 RepID=UPI0039AF3E70